MGEDTPLARRKFALRQQIIRSRPGLFPGSEARLEANRRIQDDAMALVRSRGCRSVFLYLSTPDEVQTLDLLDGLLGHGITVLVPRLVPLQQMRAVLFEGWDTLERGQLGILSPKSEIEYAGAIDMALVPGLAFSPGGERLGYGKGYYDRWLSTRPTVFRVGLCFAQQVMPSLPVDAHDQQMDIIVTQDAAFDAAVRPK